MTAAFTPFIQPCTAKLVRCSARSLRVSSGLLVFGLIQTVLLDFADGAQTTSERLLRREDLHADRSKSKTGSRVSRASSEELAGTNAELAYWLGSYELRLVEPSEKRLLVKGDETTGTNAVVTHICNDRWAPGALALAASLKHVGAKADRVLMLAADMNSTFFSLFTSYFDRVYIEQPIKEHPSIKRAGADCVTLQLRAWQLPYKKALYMDSDMVLLRNPDWLFDSYGEMSARMDHWGFGWNGGMFMCEPSVDTFSKLRNALATHNQKAKLHGMQQFLNHMFPRCNHSKALSSNLAGCMKKSFPGTQNLFSRDLKAHEADALIQGNQSSKIESVHFSGDWDTEKKPWMKGCMVGADSTTRYAGDTRMNVLNLWMNNYRRVKPENDTEAAKSLLRISCPVYDCVTSRNTMDYVVYLDNVDCWKEMMLKRLMQYAAPRRIILIANQNICDQVKANHSFSQVVCEDESAVLPEVSLASIHAWVSKKFGQNNTDSNVTGQIDDAAHLLFKQFLNLGVAEAAEKFGLSENYVVWDSNMIMIRDFCPFNREGQTNFMEGILGLENPCHKGYRVAFEEMLGEKYLISQGANKAFNSHYMVSNATVMKSLLQTISSRHNGTHWSSVIMKAACKTLENCTCGFSEYSSYASWTNKKHPEIFAELNNQYRVQCKNATCPKDTSKHLNPDIDLAVGRFALRMQGTCPPPKKKMVYEPQPRPRPLWGFPARSTGIGEQWQRGPFSSGQFSSQAIHNFVH